MSKPKPKFYVVWQGHRPGIYTTWDDTARQVQGYPGARYKSFASRAEAETAYAGAYAGYAGKNSTAVKRPSGDLASMGVVMNSVSVDAACSGNPGTMEYRGVDTATGDELFRVGPHEEGTNNIGEFLAIVHALAMLRQQIRPHVPIYSDSVSAQSWVRQKRCKTNLMPTERNAKIFELIHRAEAWLRDNPVTNPILKWDTGNWGEIPADFGRK